MENTAYPFSIFISGFCVPFTELRPGFRFQKFFLADGTTWKSYPKMTEFIQTMTQDMVGHDTELQFRTSFDGSSKGAAFIAAKHPY